MNFLVVALALLQLTHANATQPLKFLNGIIDFKTSDDQGHGHFHVAIDSKENELNASISMQDDNSSLEGFVNSSKINNELGHLLGNLSFANSTSFHSFNTSCDITLPLPSQKELDRLFSGPFDNPLFIYFIINPQLTKIADSAYRFTTSRIIKVDCLIDTTYSLEPISIKNVDSLKELFPNF